MPRLLRNNDFERQIQADNLLQVVSNDYTFLYEVEQSAQSEMISYLTQRYIVDGIFTDTTVFDISAVYYGKNLVEYTAPDFDYTVDYVVGDRIVWTDGYIYEKTDSSPAQGLTPDYEQEWNKIVKDKTLYYVKLPHPEWTQKAYSAGAQVWYNNIVYTAIKDVPDAVLTATPPILTYGITPVNPSFPILPTDTFYWSAGDIFTITEHLPTDTEYWTKGDNRNQLIVMYLIDITLYHLHARINPRNIPELRMIRYDGMNSAQNGGAIAWLKRVANGELTADLPNIIPQHGISITWGSEVRNINTY